MYVFIPNSQMYKMKYDSPRQIGNVFSKSMLVLKLMSKYIIKNVITDIMIMTVATQNPSKNGLPIDFTEVISTKFLSCLTALEPEIFILLA
jgi:hypothetical protein